MGSVGATEVVQSTHYWRCIDSVISGQLGLGRMLLDTPMWANRRQSLDSEHPVQARRHYLSPNPALVTTLLGLATDCSS